MLMPILAATLTVRQRTVPPDRYAQTAATTASLKTGAYALGAATAALLVGVLTARELVLLIGIGQLIALAPFLGQRAYLAPIDFLRSTSPATAGPATYTTMIPSASERSPS